MASRNGTAARRAPRFAVAVAAAAIVGLFGSTAVPASVQAQETDEYGYPTWAEVERARESESSKEQQIVEIRQLISNLEDEVAEAERIAEQRMAEAQEAEQLYMDAMANADLLQNQADEAQERADESHAAASTFAGALARSGGSGNMSIELFSNPGEADDVLYRLGLMDSVTGRQSTLYEQAQQDANTAQSLSEQAEIARDERDRLNQEAQEAMELAIQAQAAAEDALQEEIDHRGTLEAQLEVLTEDRAATEEDYRAGQEYREELERQRLEEERKRQEQAERERQQNEQNNNGNNNPGTGTNNPTNPPPVSGGWARPNNGGVTSNYGYRLDPLGQLGWKLHAGTDFAAGCGAPIFAAGNGTVAAKGYDVYGANFVFIDHGNGVQSRYYHMMAPASVNVGQSVSAGQVIAYEGDTGWATGCHLHFEVRVYGAPTDPLPFLRQRGVSI
ncbi:M23 family metallopeptidase [uncultured Agrococcus sp.]|uniref:M23 family metallopeptidase n=1 Tax=uncultured Agrococcus sp. TaxID=382258 RepID=UPI0025F5612A|nr:M23 family metallopeptidase [uncultured Agrococcus sp.]